MEEIIRKRCINYLKMHLKEWPSPFTSDNYAYTHFGYSWKKDREKGNVWFLINSENDVIQRDDWENFIVFNVNIVRLNEMVNEEDIKETLNSDVLYYEVQGEYNNPDSAVINLLTVKDNQLFMSFILRTLCTESNSAQYQRVI